jgi:translation initiation factor IF-2
MSEPTVKLPRNADELLREFPVKEPDFEAQAKAIEARLKGSPGGIVFDDLLRAPALPAEAGEPALRSSSRTTTAPKTNFAEMARKSVQKKDDSAAELAKELMAATAQNRRPDAEMVERVRAAGRATPQPSSEPNERTSGVVARAETVVVQPAKPAGAKRGAIIGIVGAALALAAGVALFMKSGDSPTPTSAALEAERAADAPAAAAPKMAAPAAAAARANDGVVSPEALASSAPEAPAPAPALARENAKAGAAKAASAPGAAPASKSAPPAEAKQVAVVLDEDPAPPQAAPAEHKPEPAPEPQMRPAEGNTDSVPLNPSAGAVSTALGSVRNSAQACLAGQSDPVTAVVTFAADGHVLRVSAAGSSGACIQAALSKAHIAPFAKESFSATTTIRPP